jgi:alpha-tubulin suppressor-like RCC1 family protein
MHDYTPEISVPTKITCLTDRHIANVIVANNCTFIIDTNGIAMSWGENKHGVLGVGDEISRRSPQRVLIDQPISNIFVGPHKMAAITETGLCFTRVLHFRQFNI